MRRLSALLAAALFAFTTLAPAAADARDRRGRHDGYYDRHYSDRYYDHRRRDRDDDGDAIAAGVIGLVLGLAIGAAAQDSRQRADDRYPDDRYDRRDGGYYEHDRRSGYEDEYGDRYYEEPAPQCTRRERQWDRYANRYVTVDVPC